MLHSLFTCYDLMADTSSVHLHTKKDALFGDAPASYKYRSPVCAWKDASKIFGSRRSIVLSGLVRGTPKLGDTDQNQYDGPSRPQCFYGVLGVDWSPCL